MKNLDMKNNIFGVSGALRVLTLFGISCLTLSNSNTKYVVKHSRIISIYVLLFNLIILFAYIWSLYTMFGFVESKKTSFETLFLIVLNYVLAIPAKFNNFFKPKVFNTCFDVYSAIDDVIGSKRCFTSEKISSILLLFHIVYVPVTFYVNHCLHSKSFGVDDTNESTDCLADILYHIFWCLPRTQLQAFQTAFMYLLLLFTFRLNALADYLEECYVEYEEHEQSDKRNLFVSEEFIKTEFPKVIKDRSTLIKKMRLLRANTILTLLSKINHCTGLIEKTANPALTALLTCLFVDLFMPLKNMFKIYIPAGDGSSTMWASLPLYDHLHQFCHHAVFFFCLTETCHALLKAHTRLVGGMLKIAKNEPHLWPEVSRLCCSRPAFTASRIFIIDRPIAYQAILSMLSLSLLMRQIQHDKQAQGT